MVRPELSDLLYALGYRHDPSLQTKWLIPGDYPAGWMNVPTVTDRLGYDEWRAANADPDAAAEEVALQRRSRTGAPEPETVPPDQEHERGRARRPARKEQEQLPAALARLGELAEQARAAAEEARAAAEGEEQ